MGFKEVSAVDADQTISLGGFNKKLRKDNPTEVEGYYLGSKQVASTKAKSGFSYLHVFQTEKGNLGVWGKVGMDKKLNQVTPGTMTQVTFTGTKDTPNGPMYTYKVAVDSDNVIEVSGSVGNDSGYGDAEQTGSDDSDNVEQFSPPPAASNANRVKELLKNRKAN